MEKQEVRETIRELLTLAKSKQRKNEASLKLSTILTTNENGVMNFLEAVFDFDESSQNTSTHLQRMLAIATIIGRMPKLTVCEETYFERLSPQLLHLLKINENSKPQIANKLWNSAAHIVIALNERNSKLNDDYIVHPLINALSAQSSSPHSLCDSLKAISRLISCKFPIQRLFITFPNIFYVRVKLQKSQSPLKSTLNSVLTDFLHDERAVCLLENALFCKNSLYNYYLISENDVSVNSTNNMEQETTECNLQKIDDITQTCVALLEKLSDNFKVDFFLILIDRLSLSANADSQLLVYSLIDTLQITVLTLFLKNASKAIHFVISNLDRVVKQLNSELFDFENRESRNHAEEDTNETKLTSLSTSLMIITQLIGRNNQITSDDKMLLVQCIPTIDKIMEHCKSNEECVALCTNLKKKMIDLSENVREKQDKAKLEFEEALADINDNEVHIRTHGLVVMRRLILHKNEQAMKEKQRLIIVIQALLCDQESYVYLAAIKALAALAICSTEEVLPSLFDAYRDKQRSLQERVNVGEVLLNLVKDLGGAVQKYSKLFINEFLRSMKDDEPTMRISSLSNLGQVCSLLRFAISPYIVEIFNAVKCMLETDPILEVKRASIMFIHVMLSGIDGNSIQAIEPEISNIYRLVKHVYNRSLDDVVQFHCQLAFDQFDKIGKEMLTLRQENVHTIHFT